MTHFKQRMSVEITAERLRFLLHYDPKAGVFRWRVSNSPRRLVGSIAGHMSRRSYQIGIDGSIYVGSNLAWLYMTGAWPTEGIDHKNQDPTDDRWDNLRLANQSQNNANARIRSDNTSGSRGVSWKQDKQKWKAYVNLNGKQIHCGYFNTVEEAKAARDAKAQLLYGEFTRFDTLTAKEYHS